MFANAKKRCRSVPHTKEDKLGNLQLLLESTYITKIMRAEKKNLLRSKVNEGCPEGGIVVVLAPDAHHCLTQSVCHRKFTLFSRIL